MRIKKVAVAKLKKTHLKTDGYAHSNEKMSNPPRPSPPKHYSTDSTKANVEEIFRDG